MLKKRSLVANSVFVYIRNKVFQISMYFKKDINFSLFKENSHRFKYEYHEIIQIRVR